MSEKKKILLYYCAAIGDTVVTLPLIRNICRHHSDSIIDVFNFQPGTSQYHLNLLSGIGNFRRITYMSLPFELSLKTLIPRIKNMLKFRKKKYDIIYVFYLDPPASKLWERIFRFITAPKQLYAVEETPSGMRISEFLRLQMERSGMPFLPEENTIRYPLSPELIAKGFERFAKLSIPQGKIPFVMGISGKSHTCMYWPMERYHKLLKRIVPKYKLYPVIAGAPSEKEKANDLLKVCGTGTFVSDLQAVEMIAFMKHFHFYLGNDTGTMHLADSAGIPCITLFTNKDNNCSWFPEGDHHINIIHRQDCGECRYKICPYGNPAPCIESITVEEVETAVILMLNRMTGIDVAAQK